MRIIYRYGVNTGLHCNFRQVYEVDDRHLKMTTGYNSQDETVCLNHTVDSNKLCLSQIIRQCIFIDIYSFLFQINNDFRKS